MSDVGQQMRAGAAMGVYSALIPDWVLEREKDFFAYQVRATPLGVLGTATPQFIVNADADFLLTTMNGVVTDPADETTVEATPGILISLQDAGSGRYLFSEPVAWLNTIGTGQLPYYLPFPKFITAGSAVTVTLQALAGQVASNVRVTFGGFKIFRWLEPAAPPIQRRR